MLQPEQMQPHPNQSADGRSTGTSKKKKEKRKETKTLLVFCAWREKKGITNWEENKNREMTKTINDFISWTLPNVWDISEVIIEEWLIRQQ